MSFKILNMLIFFIILMLSVSSSARVFTSVQTGSYSNSSTWGGTRFPGDSTLIDTFYVNTGHVVTLNNNVSVRNVTGSLRGTLSVYGSIILAGHIYLRGGSNLRFEAGSNINLAGNGIIDTSVAGNRTITIAGTLENRVIIRDTTGTGYISTEASDNWQNAVLNWTYCDFQNLGSDWLFYSSTAPNIQNCTFTNCGQIQFRLSSNNVNFTMSNCDFIGSGGGNLRPLFIRDLGGNNVTSATRLLNKCSFRHTSAGSEIFLMTRGFKIKDCVFNNIFINQFWYYTHLTKNLFMSTSRSDPLYTSVGVGSKIDSCYFWSNVDNPHDINIVSDLGDSVQIINNVFEHIYSAPFTDHGDHIIMRETATGKLVISHNLLIDHKSGAFLNTLGNGPSPDDPTNVNLYVHHNTLFYRDAMDYGLLYRTENGGYLSGHSEFIYNMIVNTGTNNERGINIEIVANNIIDTIDYNCFVRLPSTNISDRYYGMTSTLYTENQNWYGGRDITVNPNFVDTTRNILSYAVTFGSVSSTEIAMLDYFLKINGYETSTQSQTGTITDINSLLSWVKYGYASKEILTAKIGFLSLSANVNSFIPSSAKRNSIISVLGNICDSTENVRIFLNSVNCSLTKWSQDTVKFTVPSWAPRGYYSIILKAIIPSDTIILDSANTRLRIFLPEIIRSGR